jgi:hypothetical protein
MRRKRLPLDYMLAVMNDPEASSGRRDLMAIRAAPYCHRRLIDDPVGKKQQRSEAAANVGGAGTGWSRDLDFEAPPN